jgi:hypothetical protein
MGARTARASLPPFSAQDSQRLRTRIHAAPARPKVDTNNTNPNVVPRSPLAAAVDAAVMGLPGGCVGWPRRPRARSASASRPRPCASRASAPIGAAAGNRSNASPAGPACSRSLTTFGGSTSLNGGPRLDPRPSAPGSVGQYSSSTATSDRLEHPAAVLDDGEAAAAGVANRVAETAKIRRTPLTRMNLDTYHARKP